MKTFQICFNKGAKRKKRILIEADSYRRNGDLIEFLDKSGIVIERFGVLQISGVSTFSDDDDPLFAVHS